MPILRNSFRQYRRTAQIFSYIYILNNLLNFKDISKTKRERDREQMKGEEKKSKGKLRETNKKIKVNKQIT